MSISLLVSCKSYQWNDLVRSQVLQSTLGQNVPILVFTHFNIINYIMHVHPFFLHIITYLPKRALKIAVQVSHG